MTELNQSAKLNKRGEVSLERAAMTCFCLGLLLEILILILDKSSWINPFEGQMFRISFLSFALKVCFTKYSRNEWLAIIGTLLLAGTCYLVSTRDEAVRVVVFVAAMKGVDYKKAMKKVFWGTVFGMTVLAGLAFAGVLGEVVDVGAGYGFKEEMTRLCLGVGNSNALACMLWALMTLGIYLYHEKMRKWHYALLLAFCVLVYVATVTRTALLVMAATVFLAFILQYSKRLQSSAWVYVCGIFTVLAGLGFSVWAAYISDWYEYLPAWVVKIDRILTGRITSIYPFANGGGVLENWKLFGDPSYVEYFDMGYVRLFFWYGIIPGIFCVLVLCLLIWECRKQKDHMAFVLVMSFALYTVIEAHAVSVYIGRNYVLLLLGAFWPYMLCGSSEQRTSYWWRSWELFKEGKGHNEKRDCV